MDLLDRHYAVLNSALRQSLVKSLILLRNRGHLKSAEVLPLFFRLFRCQDKNLRDLLFKHIVAGTHQNCLCRQLQQHVLAVLGVAAAQCRLHTFDLSTCTVAFLARLVALKKLYEQTQALPDIWCSWIMSDTANGCLKQ